MLRSLNRVFTRILVLALLALGALAAFGWFVIGESRNNLYEQKKADIRNRCFLGQSTQDAALDRTVGAIASAMRMAERDRVVVRMLCGRSGTQFDHGGRIGTLRAG